MSKKCQHTFPSGERCRRYTNNPNGFCHFHDNIPRAEDFLPGGKAYKPKITGDQPIPELKHLESLDSYDDVYMTVRQTLHSICTGQIPPSRAFAVGYLVDLWMRVREKRAADKVERRVFRPKLADPEDFQELIYRQVADAVWEHMLGKGNTPQTTTNLDCVDSVGHPARVDPDEAPRPVPPMWTPPEMWPDGKRPPGYDADPASLRPPRNAPLDERDAKKSNDGGAAA